MQLTRLRVFQYRNIRELEFAPSGGTNLFFGLNGQGKTNLLEAIYFLAYGKSFRTATTRDCIQQGRDEFRLEGKIEHGTLKRDLQVWTTPTEKRLLLFGKQVALVEFVGNLHLLAFTHEHLKVVRGGPADRRAFIDRAMVALYPGHITHLAAYGRALRQRNRILSSWHQSGTVDEAVLESWDETLVREGTFILSNRLSYVKQMIDELPQGLFGAETLGIHYLSSVAVDSLAPHQIETQFRKRLQDLRSHDRKSGFTSVGPHRDDLKLSVNGKPLVNFGSAGQQRSGLLALYFSQMEIHRKTHGFYPVFLVDDAEAELDQQRLNVFLRYLSQRTQIFLTSAKDFLLPFVAEQTLHFEIRNGALSENLR